MQPWSLVYACDSVDDMLACFKDLFNSVWNKHVPLKTRIACKDSNPWFTKAVLAAMRHRDHLYNCFCKSNADNDWMAYKAARNYCTAAIRTAKRAFLLTLLKPTHEFFGRN